MKKQRSNKIHKSSNSKFVRKDISSSIVLILVVIAILVSAVSTYVVLNQVGIAQESTLYAKAVAIQNSNSKNNNDYTSYATQGVVSMTVLPQEIDSNE